VGQNTFQGDKDFCFYDTFNKYKKKFARTTKFWGTASECAPLSTAWAEPD